MVQRTTIISTTLETRRRRRSLELKSVEQYEQELYAWL